jgi:hypothetical protein
VDGRRNREEVRVELKGVVVVVVVMMRFVLI